MAVWYCGSTKYTAVTQWAATTAYNVGDLRRQLAAPSAGNERVFRCTTAGTSGGSEPAWNLTKGATTNDGGAVWTEVTGNSTYGWNAAAARLRLFADNGGSPWAAAGDTIYVSNNHAATEAGVVNYTFPGTAANPNIVQCVSDSAAPPTSVASTATESMTSNTQGFFQGFAYIEGITFNAGSTTNAGSWAFGFVSPYFIKLVNCSVRLLGTSNSAYIAIGNPTTGADDCGVEWENVTVFFSSTSQGIYPTCPFKWSNTASAIVGGSSIPNYLFYTSANQAPYVLTELHGVDLSALNTKVANSIASFASYLLVNCQTHASVSLLPDAVNGQGGVTMRAVNYGSGNTNYKYFLKVFQGTITEEVTIVRTGGATDGTTPASRKMVTTADSKFTLPLKSDPMTAWNETTGSAVTVTIEVITDNVTLTDAEAWVEVEYLGTASLPLSVFTKDRAADILATPANQTSSSASWTTTGLATPVKQQLSISFTPQKKGPFIVRVCLAKASTTMYFDPLNALSIS